MRQLAFLALAVIALSFAAVSAHGAHAGELTLSGEVTYRERMALPDPASLRVRLVDLTREGAPATIEAEAVLPARGQVPLSFTLNFADSVVVDGHRYGIVAEILSGETVFFRNAAPVSVDPASGAPADVLVNFLGMDGEDGASTLEVAASPSVADITWQQIDATPAATLAIAGDLRAGGKAACNSWFASVELGDGTIAFGAIAATRMACPPPVAAAEQAFFAALAQVRAYNVAADRLTLLDEAGKPLLRFRQASE